MRKAQTEIIGLVVVVILIVIGALFYLKFVILGEKGEESHKEDVISSTQAYNLMNAIMNIEICGNVSIREGFTMCKNNGNLCNEPACAYLDNEIDKIAKSVLYKDYSMNISSSGWNHNIGSCKKYGVSSYPYIYTIKGESFRAVLKLC